MKKTLVFLLCFSLFSAQSRQLNKGTVVVVYDGDTVKVKSDNGFERRVRLIGIDTPEIEDTPANTPLEALLAKRFTFHHLYRKSVKLSYDREIEDRNHIGKLGRVRFLCARIRKSGSLLFLLAKSGDFTALIPKEYLSLFGDIQSMKGRTIQVFGFLEEYRGQPQIMLFFPSQIINLTESSCWFKQ